MSSSISSTANATIAAETKYQGKSSCAELEIVVTTSSSAVGCVDGGWGCRDGVHVRRFSLEETFARVLASVVRHELLQPELPSEMENYSRLQALE
ncbi:hypothetical protein P43SY_010803 [Pythium insidiosum]|uniref:Uncharacterized protein n=1 Tax=Pythium insidiosum TaxID=114742 RepID=A0AAD5LRG4_PYTIN|nr:hypothetical protein P43SY_010803 [Pythium insidiosum]